METIEKLNLILKKVGISKVNLAKYLGVSRQMVYNYLDSKDLEKWPKEKKAALFKLLEVKNSQELRDIEITPEYIELIEAKMYNSKKNAKKDELIELSGLKKEEQEIISDIFFLIKEMCNENKTKETVSILTYIYHFIQIMNNTKELKYVLAYFSKAAGYIKPLEFAFHEDQQYIFESIMYSAMTLYNNGGASRTKLTESHRRFEAEIEQKQEEKLSRTQELNTAKIQALKELGYTEINEQNAGEVFDKIAEIQARNVW